MKVVFLFGLSLISCLAFCTKHPPIKQNVDTPVVLAPEVKQDSEPQYYAVEPDPVESPALETVPSATVDFQPVYFDFDSYNIRFDALVNLGDNLEIIKKSSAKVVIEGYADDRGTVQYNFALGQRRAAAVLRWLRDNGMTNKARCVSQGEGNPVAFNCVSDDCWQQNRRVTIRFE